jgi:hypothetical protein
MDEKEAFMRRRKNAKRELEKGKASVEQPICKELSE